MKRKFTLILILVVYSSTAFSQWQSLGNDLIPANHRTWSVKVAPDSSFWAISTYDAFPPPNNQVPKVHRSADRGETWLETTIWSAQSNYGWDISPVDSMTAYVALHTTGIFRTTDGGASWLKVDSFALPFCLVVHFFNANEGWTLGSDGVRLTMGLTSDGGNSWTYLGGANWDQPPGTSLPAMDDDELAGFNFSVNSYYDYTDNAIIFGQSKGTYWISTDKGYNWERRSTPLADLGFMTTNVAMKDTNTFMVASDTKAVDFSNVTTVSFTTTNGGETWIAGAPGITAAASHYLPNSDSVFIMVGHNDFGSGGAGTAITYDYGETWEQLDNTSIIAIDFIDENTGIGACCNNIWPTANGQIHRWDFELPTAVSESAIASSFIQLMPNPVSDHLRIYVDGEVASPYFQVEIFSVDGQLMLSEKRPPISPVQINVESLPQGFYTLRLTADGRCISEKLIKN